VSAIVLVFVTAITVADVVVVVAVPISDAAP